MNPKLRRNLSGAFQAQDLGAGAWRLCQAAPREIDVYLQGSDRRAAQAFGATRIGDLGIEWRSETVQLSFVSGDRIETVEAASAIVHEPMSHLYESLPLQSFDADARRFWRRVFRVVRIPGGRYLLRLLSRLPKR
jgi:hypothetical protein